MKNTIVKTNVKDLLKYGVISLIAGTFLVGCGSTEDNESSSSSQIFTAPASFTTDVHPILNSKCSSCHSGNKGGFTANSVSNVTYSSMKNIGYSRVLTTGNGGNGHDGGDQLTDSEYTTILNWINSGQTTATTTVTVERGAVYDANVTDINGNVAKKNKGTNTYTFDTTPTYPIKAIGGWIDVDGDGNKTVGTDVILDIPLTSYSNIITPVTTYIGDVDKNRSKLDKLIDDLNASETELLKKPSEADYKAILTQNSIYKIMKENNTTQLDDNHFDDINTSYHTLETTYKQSYESQEKTSKELAQIFEKETMDDLEVHQHINRMDESEKLEFEKNDNDNDSNENNDNDSNDNESNENNDNDNDNDNESNDNDNDSNDNESNENNDNESNDNNDNESNDNNDNDSNANENNNSQSNSSTNGSTNENNTTTSNITFKNNVLPTITTNCSSCHSGGTGGFTANGNALTTYNSMKNKGFSRILTTGNGGNGHSGGDKLSNTNTTTIQEWINAGALNN